MDNDTPEQAPVEPTVDTAADTEAPAVAGHTIELRSFARDSADEPMPVTVVTGA